MLRHTGKRRSFRHNLGLAVLLSFNAGFVNAAGFMAFGTLTTNVTGHAALLSIELANGDFHTAKIALTWLAVFLCGSFSSGILVSAVGQDKHTAYLGPLVLILICLITVFLFARPGQSVLIQHFFSGTLLFAMGSQNAMVTVISGSVVRTTHLTGIFTDLGVDLARMAVNGPRPMLKLRTLLRLCIIFSFLSGGIVGSIGMRNAGFTALLAPIIILLLSLFYDHFRVRIKKLFIRSVE